MTPLKLNGKTLLPVDVPDGANGFKIWKEFHIRGKYMNPGVGFNHPDPEIRWEEIELPPGNWSILGRLNDITEEQAAGLVDGKGGLYKDYMALDNGYEYDLLATESLKSYFRYHGVDGNLLILILNK